MRKRVFCSLAAALAIGLAACGSGNGSSAGTGKTVAEDLESSEDPEEDGNADASLPVDGQLLTTPYFNVKLPEAAIFAPFRFLTFRRSSFDMSAESLSAD